jgi:hypothetical protein
MLSICDSLTALTGAQNTGYLTGISPFDEPAFAQVLLTLSLLTVPSQPAAKI